MITYKSLASGAKAVIKSAVARKYRTLVEQSWHYDSTAWRRCQEERFREIYNRTRITVPYYRDRPSQYPELQPNRSVQEFLPTLPLLPKSTVREHNKEFWPSKSGFLRTEHRTSGSTGSPLILAATLQERALTESIMQSWYRRICGSSWPRTLALSGFMTPGPKSSELYWHDPIARRLYLSIYSLSVARRSEILEVIRWFRPTLVYGYTSAIAELGRLVDDALADQRESMVAVVTSETMREHDRTLILANLVGRVFNLYGSQESSHMALECEWGSWHVMPLVGIIEILDDRGNPASAGSSGQVVVTGLCRASMPLMRYAIGDSAVSTGFGQCTCGLQWPTMGQVEGRCEDLVRTRDGRRIGLLAFAATKTRTGIKEAQVIQHSYTDFEIKLVMDSPESVARKHTESGMTAELTKRLGYPVTPTFHYIDQIPRGPRGKFKAVVVDFKE